MAMRVGKLELLERTQISADSGRRTHHPHLVHHKEVFSVNKILQTLHLSAPLRRLQALATTQIRVPVYLGLSQPVVVFLVVRQLPLPSQLIVFLELLDRQASGHSRTLASVTLARVFLETMLKRSLPLVASAQLIPTTPQVALEPLVVQVTSLVPMLRLVDLERNNKIPILPPLDRTRKVRLDSVVDLAAVTTIMLLNLPCLELLTRVLGVVVFLTVLTLRTQTYQGPHFSEAIPIPNQPGALYSGLSLRRQVRRVSSAGTMRPLQTAKLLQPLAGSALLDRINRVKEVASSVRTTPQNPAYLAIRQILEAVFLALVTIISSLTLEAVSSEHPQITRINKTRLETPSATILLWAQQAFLETLSSKTSFNHPVGCPLHYWIRIPMGVRLFTAAFPHHLKSIQGLLRLRSRLGRRRRRRLLYPCTSSIQMEYNNM